MKSNLLIILIINFMLISCGDKDSKATNKKRQINITTATALIQTFEERESAIGSIEGLMDPTIKAEISGSVQKIFTRTGSTIKKGDLLAQLEDRDYKYQLDLAKAELRQLKARLNGQEKTYQRNLGLVEKKFISPNALDEIINTKDETLELIEIANAKVNIAKSTLLKTKVYAPISGKIEKQIASIGDYLKVGDAIVQIMNNDRLRAHIPFPEKLASKLKPGIMIKLESPITKDILSVKIAELKPQIISDSKAIDVIADIIKQPNWQSGGSVRGTVILQTKNSIGIPEQSIVLRPAGKVVYIVKNKIVSEQKVTTGITQNGLIEITSGLKINQVVALDGAGYLTDKAEVNIKK